MKASQTMVGAFVALCGIGVGQADATTVTWGGDTGDWNTAARWVGGVVPVAGDDIVINGGVAQVWLGGTGNQIRDNTTLTINGGEVDFPNQSHWVNVGTGGSGTASALTINAGGTYDMNGGQLAIGNAAGEIGVVTVGAGGTLMSNNAWIEMQTTGTLNTAGTVSGFGDINVRGGTINVTGGTFSASALRLLGSVTTTLQFNILGGEVIANTYAYNDWDVSYINFSAGSTGVLKLANVSTATLSGYLTNGRIRIDGVTDASAFVVSAYGANGAQVSLVPEPASVAMLMAGAGLMASRRRKAAE